MDGKISQTEYVIVIASHHLTAHEKIYVQISSTADLLFYDARERKRGRRSRWRIMGEVRPQRRLYCGGFPCLAHQLLKTTLLLVQPGSDRSSVTTSPQAVVGEFSAVILDNIVSLLSPSSPSIYPPMAGFAPRSDSHHSQLWHLKQFTYYN